MAATSGTATSYLDLLDKLRRFAAGYGTAGTPTPGGGNTGNGTVTGVDTHPGTITETFTLTCTTGGGTGVGIFSVVGSSSGSLASATVGSAYTSAFIDFTINDGAVDFIVGDTFTIAVTIGALADAGEEWTIERWTGGNELILRGPGLSLDKEIYVGFKADASVPGDYYNLDCRGFTGYANALTFANQPGVSPAKYLSLWNSSIPYWFVVNGQRIIVVAKVSTTYHLGYFGLWLPYGQPSAFPYPLLISASTGTPSVRWSSTDDDHANLTGATYDSGNDRETGQGTCFYAPDGAWYSVSRVDPSATYSDGIAQIWPYGRSGSTSATAVTLPDFDTCPDGTYWLLPCILKQSRPVVNLLGELDGIYATTGQSLASEDTIDVGGTDHLAVQDIFRTGRGNYCAVKLA